MCRRNLRVLVNLPKQVPNETRLERAQLAAYNRLTRINLTALFCKLEGPILVTCFDQTPVRNFHG